MSGMSIGSTIIELITWRIVEGAARAGLNHGIGFFFTLLGAGPLAAAGMVTKTSMYQRGTLAGASYGQLFRRHAWGTSQQKRSTFQAFHRNPARGDFLRQAPNFFDQKKSIVPNPTLAS